MKACRAQLGFLAPVGTVASLVLLLSSCGGGGGASPPPSPPPLKITTTSLPNGITGQWYYSGPLKAAGGTTPYTWSLVSGSQLAPGLYLAAGSWIEGYPSSAGTFTFTLQVQDSGSRTASREFTIVIKETLAITTSRLPKGIIDEPYEYTLEAKGGDPPYTWSLEPGYSLPAGLSLASSGTISGTPTEAVGSSFAVKVQDAASQAANTWLWLGVVKPLTITTSSLPDGNIAVPYWANLQAEGGQQHYTWSLEPGSTLPSGLSLNPYGSIEGTPLVAGTFNLNVRVSDSGYPTLSATATVRLFIDNQLAILTQWLPDVVVTENYTYTVQALGGTPPYTWAITGADPAGVFSINPSTGEISGSPSEARCHYVTVEVTDASTPTQSASRLFSIYVLPLPYFSTTSLPDGVRATSYSAYVSVGGGRGPYTLRLAAGNFPSGLSLSSTGPEWWFLITGTPTNLGQSNFTLELADSSSPPHTVTRDFSIRINEPLVITTTSLPEGWTGDPYSATLTAAGGIPPYTWSIGWPPLPQGLTLDPSTGQISGTPTQAFNGSVRVSVLDSSNPPQQPYKWLPLRIIGRLIITTTRLPAARPNDPYRVTLGLTGGTAPYAWSISSGALPDGLSLYSTTGLIYGTPTREGTQTFAIQVTDTGPPVQTVTRDLTLQITSSLGRNDTIATATPVSNGIFRVSISPYADPVSGPANPDNDYYVLAANPGAVVTVEIQAKRLVPESPLDSVIEIVDSEGTRFTTCRNEGYTDGLQAGTYDYTPTAFDDVCVNDDIEIGVIQDSKLEFQVPGTPGTPLTFYVRVLDWSGNARPDFVYDLVISGAN